MQFFSESAKNMLSILWLSIKIIIIIALIVGANEILVMYQNF